jgi:phage terminase large subunit-like protein
MTLPDLKVNRFFFPTNLSTREVIRLYDQEASELRAKLDAHDRARNTPHVEQIVPDGDVRFDLLQPIDEWIEENCYDYTSVNEVTLKLDDPRKPPKKIVLEEFQKRILRHIFPPGGYNGRLSKYTTIIWSQPKKCGKTQIAACVGAYFAALVDPPNVVLAIANKKDQAQDRVYRSMKPMLKALGGDVKTAVNSKPEIFLPNGTQVKALPNNPSTEAGDSYCLTLWTEIWAFKSETDERLFAELMPVETRRVSMRWIETYAGYTDESKTLLRLFLKAWTSVDEKELQDGSEPNTSAAYYVAELDDIITDQRPACVEIPEEEMFIFWDHDRRLPWQTDEAYKRESRNLPRTEAIRLMQNRWQASSSEMLEPAWIDAAKVESNWIKAYEKDARPFTLAVDAAMRHDSIALVGSDKQGESYCTPYIEIHDPHGQDADLHELVETKVKELYDANLLRSYFDAKQEKYITPVYFDPYQLHQIRLNLMDYGVDVIEFNQGEMRTRADTMLYHLYKDGLIWIPKGREDFYEHLAACKAKYSEGEKLRIVKGTTVDSKRIDAAVAQSMSCYGAFLADLNDLDQNDDQSLLLLGSTKNGWFGGE